MNKAAPHEILCRLFEVIASEAEKNQPFARKLAEALADAVPDQVGKPAESTRKRLDAPDLHAVNILRLHGESALRGKLEQVRALEGLRAVANVSGLVLSGSASKPKASRADLIDGIIAAAKHYDAQRTTASAAIPDASAT